MLLDANGVENPDGDGVNVVMRCGEEGKRYGAEGDTVSDEVPTRLISGLNCSLGGGGGGGLNSRGGNGLEGSAHRINR